LWKAYLLKFLDSYSYFSFSLVFTLFLSDEFGMTDVQAGSVYGAWGALITIFGLITGTIIDNLGVATCLRMGSALSLLARIALFLTSSTRVLLACLLVALPLGQCLGIPVLTVGVRRYTTSENRGFAFGLYYVVMNVGALVAGMLVDALTAHYRRGGEGGSYHGHGGGGGGSGDGGGGDGDSSFDDNDDDDNDVNDRMLAQDDASSTPSSSSSSDWAMTANRAIILSGVVANLAAVLVAFTVREIKVDDSSGGSSNKDNDDDDDGDHSN
jgi:MFS family permease